VNLLMTGLWQDVRHATRSLIRTPGFTTVALLVLTLSIGVLTAIFSVVDAVVIRSLPFEESERLVAVGERNTRESSRTSQNRVAPQNYLDWRDRQDVFTALGATWETSISLRRDDGGEPETIRAQWATSDLFSALRVSPAIGRPFTSNNEIPGHARVTVISHALWQRRFGGATDIVGKPLPGLLGDFEILGVMPPGFSYPVHAREPTEAWIPYVPRPEDRVRGNSFGYNLQVIGRLRDGVSLAQAQQRMNHITAELAKETPRWFTDRVAMVESLQEYVTRPVRQWMFMLLAAAMFVMLIACVNLANLMLVRATTRVRDVSVRTALGASRWHLARMLIAESLMLSLAGAFLGVLVAHMAVDALRLITPVEVPRAAAIAVDGRVLIATTLAAIGTGLLFGMAPLLHFWRWDTSLVLHHRERAGTADNPTQRLRAGLVVAEVALAIVLLIGAGLFLSSFARVTAVDLGLDRHNVLMVRIRPYVGPPQASTSLPVTSPENARARHPEMLERVLERVRAIPGVNVAALAGGGLPLRGDLITVNFGIPGRELPRNTDIALNEVSPDFFDALSVHLQRGRVFTDADRQGSLPVAIVSEAAARRYFGDEDAVGKVVQLRGARTIVGVVGNIRHDGPEVDVRTQAYVPFAQSRLIAATVILQTSVNPQTILPAVKNAAWSEFPNLPIADADTLDQYFGALVAQRGFNMLLIGLFGLLGLAIASLGMYGVLSYVVVQRTNEIGIRLALGAVPSSIRQSILQRAMSYIVLGTGIGVAAAYLLARFVTTLLFEVKPDDPTVYACAVAVVVITGIIAAFAPALRASRVDPLVALRYE
jgi:putative ABC transport system permease protein